MELIDVKEVKTLNNTTLEIVFENGEKRKFDMTPFLSKKPYTRLQNSPLFHKVFIQYGIVVWPGNIDIAPDTLWDGSVPA